MSRRKKHTPKDPLQKLKLATAKARLAKLEAELPPPSPQAYTRYEDLPPLMPEDRDRLKAELIEQLEKARIKHEREKYEWYMSMAHLAP